MERGNEAEGEDSRANEEASNQGYEVSVKWMSEG